MDRAIKKKTFTLKRVITGVVSLSFVGIVLYNFVWGDHSSKLDVKTERLTISTVNFGEFQEWTTATGSIVPKTTHYLDAIEGGRVREIFVEAGETVKEGQPLLRMENTDLRFSIMAQEASVIEQENGLESRKFQIQNNNMLMRQGLIDSDYNLERLKRDYERKEKLFAKNAISEETFLLAKDEYEYRKQLRVLAEQRFIADSTLSARQLVQIERSAKTMRDNFNFARARLEKLVLRAPVGGQLTSFTPDIGENKNRGERLGYIDVLDGGYKAEVNVDEYYLPRVKVRQKATWDHTGKTYTLVIERVYPEVLAGNFIVDMVFIGEIPPDIRTGQTVHTKLQLGELSTKLLLPRGGFYSKTGGNWVYVVDPATNTAIKRIIKIGRQNNNYFEVLEGLEPGEKVITSTYDNFGDIDKLILDKDVEDTSNN